MPTLLRRIQRRMGLAGKRTLAEYVAYLREQREEPVALANDLMINVTGFFRDPEAWEALRGAVVRPLVEGQQPGQPIRAWVAACASGEEAYTLAMLIAEEAGRAQKPVDARIFATDTAGGPLAFARAGVYPAGIEGDVSPERLDRFFEKQESAFRIRQEIRDMVVFAPQDVLRDPPFSRLDLCTCRNLMIYLEPEAQRRLLASLHFALREGGALFLGNAESPTAQDGLFETISKRWRIYRRVHAGQSRFGEVARLLPGLGTRLAALGAGTAFATGSSTPPPTPLILQASLLDEYVPTMVIVGGDDRVAFFHGDTARYLLQPTGEPTRQLFDLLRPGLRAAARTALREAARSGREETAAVDGEGADGQLVLKAAPLALGRQPPYYRLSFETVASTAHPVERARPAEPASPLDVTRNALEDELRVTRRELQATLEAFETNNAELKASHEELTSMNEELQSSNEELETSKEELQSLNEELHSVNAQLQSKIGELEDSNNDLLNLLGSTDVAVIFLDTDLRIRRYTPAVHDLVELIPGDVGRPIGDLAQKFTGPDLGDDARTVIAQRTPADAEVQSTSGKWYLRRTLPYRTAASVIDGVVVTFIDITARRAAERAIVDAQARMQAVIDQMPTAVVVVESPAGRLALANRRAAALFGHPFPLPFLGEDWPAAHAAFRGFREDGRPLEAEEWPLARTLATGEAVADQEIAFQQADGKPGILLASAGPVLGPDGRMLAVVATFWDVTQIRLTDLALRLSETRLHDALEAADERRSTAEAAAHAKDDFVATAGHELRTPLNIIRLWAGVLSSKQVPAKTLSEGLGIIDRAAAAQGQIIDDLLDVSRMTLGKLQLDLRPMPLAATIDTALGAVRPLAEARGLSFETDVSPAVGTVVADADRIRQIVWNLTTNAVKFTDPGGSVRVTVARNGGVVEMRVVDTGIGISAESLPHVFDRFWQEPGTSTRAHGSLGLGLAIARQLVELHGGTIRAESEGPGRGATFVVELPLPALPTAPG